VRIPRGAAAQNCSQSIINAGPGLSAFTSRLAAANKKPKVIIVAVMRKMITTLNAMLRDNIAWQSKSA
jgi:transposase